MPTLSRRQFSLASIALSLTTFRASGAAAGASYKVKYSGGSLPGIKTGQDLTLTLSAAAIKFESKHIDPLSIPASSVTEVNFGQEVHRRIGTAIGLAVFSLGIGALMAFSKSKKHYIGVVWDDQGKKGGLALQANKNEYRGLIAALEGLTGKKAVDTDAAAKQSS